MNIKIDVKYEVELVGGGGGGDEDEDVPLEEVALAILHFFA